jgi:tyrosine-specific transport protein
MLCHPTLKINQGTSMDSKLLGGILLIVGTSSGAGMRALTIVTAGSGFFASSLMLFACWVFMTFSAFLILEVNLWFPSRSNLISMARATLGMPGVAMVWGSYILLLYALLAAYISGGSALFHDLLGWVGWRTAPDEVSSILFVLVFGYLVYRGIQPVDYVNRALMAVKMTSLFLLILLTVPHLHGNYLTEGNPKLVISTVTVMVTSFGFATIIPSLRSYFNDDVNKLRRAILIGSLIPFVCYFLWDLSILGSVPREGEEGLFAILQRGGSTTELTHSLNYYFHNTSINFFSHLFTVICILTSFLGVSLGLSDFLSDGLAIQKSQTGNKIICLLTFLPPLAIVLFYPSIFVKALNYAGLCAVILMALLPALMTWRGRYQQSLARKYQVVGGKIAIFSVIMISLVVVLLGLKEII